MSLEYSIAKANLERLIINYSPLGELSNEAQTRFSFIDILLESCLGWPKSLTKVEHYENGNRSDYECGTPRALVIEAKKSAEPFLLPPKGNKKKISIKSLISFNEEVAAAIHQVQTYGFERGIKVVAISNGPQLIVFLATRQDGTAPLQGDALVFDGFDELLKGFSSIYDALSKDGIEEGRLVEVLSSALPASLPPKLSASCINYLEHRYSNQFQESIRNAAALIIEDLGRTDAFEEEFLKSCYCESGPLTQYSLIGKSLLAARYAALFPSNVAGSKVESTNPKKDSQTKGSFSEQVLQEALARRPVVLVGDVGVGKTTFIKHLIHVSAKEVFKKSICIYFDLGSKGALSRSPKDALLNGIEETLRDVHGINLMGTDLIEAIYKKELQDFDTGYFSQLKAIDAGAFLKERLDYVKSFISRRDNHLKLCLEHLAKAQKCQAVIVIDNADQRSFDVQQEAFLIAHELASNWSAMVFLALRPQTFHASKRSGTISAYPTKIFVIHPPKLEDAIEKRLIFARRMAEGRIPIHTPGITLHIDSLAKLIQALIDSLARSKDLYEFIVNVSGGNVRVAIELVSRYLGSPNIASDQIVKAIIDQGSYLVPLHEFSKAALLGDSAHFQEQTSAATNLFSIFYRDPREHFLASLIIGFLSWDGASTSKSDGFVPLAALVSEMQANGFVPEQIESHIQRLTKRKLIETSERRLLETAEEVKEFGYPEAFRVTSVGAYHLKKWAGEFAYIEAMSFETPIFDDAVRGSLLPTVNDDRLLARYERATAFRDYLGECWRSMQPRPYFDWLQLEAISIDSFGRVARNLRGKNLIK